jgi:hypothetical protein
MNVGDELKDGAIESSARRSRGLEKTRKNDLCYE